MLLYRVYGSIPGARRGAPGSPSYLHRPQSKGRWDNPSLYDGWYLARSAEGAVAETFGNLATWSAAMFERPYLPGGRLTLGVFEVPDEVAICDLDDAATLVRLGMRPSQVVIRDPSYTRRRAADIFAEDRWAGIGWWSFHRPNWSNVLLWSTPAAPAPLRHVADEGLALDHPALVEAARALAKWS